MKNTIKHAVTTLLCAAVAAGLAACDADPVEQKGGKLPEKEPLENVYGMLRSGKSSEKTIDVLLTEGVSFAKEPFYFQQTRPAAEGYTLEPRADESLLDAYNAAEGVERRLLPAANYDFPDGKMLTLGKDDQRSASVNIRFRSEGLEAGEYALPLTVADATAPDAEKTLYYNITVRRPQLGDVELHVGDDMYFVFYINTTQYQPLLVDDYYMRKKLARGTTVKWYSIVGDLINLRTVTLDYEASTGRARLNLGSDISWVLDHALQYIRPLQDKGRKVCLCLEGGGKGLGFCNLSDAQIADFAAQTAAVVGEYGLDGVNLWDRNAGYGKENMPPMNTLSYPKLIQALRKALGSEKLLTVTVYDKPTESFWDTEASGGIAVGDYIDYAWSGYNSNEETPQLLDPWHPELDYVSAYTQKPIANLPQERYGCINFPIYSGSTRNNNNCAFLVDWINAGYKPNSIIVFDDLRTNLQDAYETVWDIEFANCCTYYDSESRYILGTRTGYAYLFDINRTGGLTWIAEDYLGYGKWLKDW